MIGSSLAPNSAWRMVVARFNANGSLDQTFATNGWYRGDVMSPSASRGSAVGVTPEGRVVYASCCTLGGGDESAALTVGRLRADGRPDPDFFGGTWSTSPVRWV